MFPKRKVCLFGTSANPPTGRGGHLGIVIALSQLGIFDEVRVLPVYRHMFADKRKSTQGSFQDRIEMCRLSFKDLPNVTVSDQEEKCFHWVTKRRNLTEPLQTAKLRVGTANLLEMLIENEPNTDFTMAMGSDTFKDLVDQKWKRADDIINLLCGRIVVFARKFNEPKSNMSCQDIKNLSGLCDDKQEDDDIYILNTYIEKVNQKFRDDVKNSYISLHKKDKNPGTNNRSNERKKTAQIIAEDSPSPVHLLKIESLTSVSSSLIRSTTNENVEILNNMLQPDVLDYIIKKKLYGFSLDC